MIRVLFVVRFRNVKKIFCSRIKCVPCYYVHQDSTQYCPRIFIGLLKLISQVFTFSEISWKKRVHFENLPKREEREDSSPRSLEVGNFQRFCAVIPTDLSNVIRKRNMKQYMNLMVTAFPACGAACNSK